MWYTSEQTCVDGQKFARKSRCSYFNVFEVFLYVVKLNNKTSCGDVVVWLNWLYKHDNNYTSMVSFYDK